MHKALPSTTLYYKACTQLAQSTSQYYFVLQSLHKALPSTTLYYKSCTKHFAVLLYTQSTSQYYFVLQSLPKFAQSTSQYYCVLQWSHQYYFVLPSLHKALPSTTLYYKACTKLAQSSSHYNAISRHWIAKHNRTTRNGVGAKAKQTWFGSTFKMNFKGKISWVKIEKICWHITIAALMQPLQYDLRGPAARDNNLLRIIQIYSKPSFWWDVSTTFYTLKWLLPIFTMCLRIKIRMFSTCFPPIFHGVFWGFHIPKDRDAPNLAPPNLHHQAPGSGHHR